MSAATPPSSPPPNKACHRNEPVNLSLPPDDCAYLDRRANDECHGNRSALVRKMIREAKAFRHDLRGPVNAIALIAIVVKTSAAPPAEILAMLEQTAADLKALLASTEQ